MLCYCKTIVTLLFVDVSPYKNTFLRKSDRQRISLKWGGMQPEGGQLYVVILTAIDNHSLIIVDTVLLQKNSDNTFY